ncbi:unnamed protein product [Phytomonas sp. Hart1]|nr:unnamed protein product [Phytomonas sp. Hart1]|eukprot:CCW68375.1 unnamed protein product [Phytomonas sp. isolate Hart1]
MVIEPRETCDRNQDEVLVHLLVAALAKEGAQLAHDRVVALFAPLHLVHHVRMRKGKIASSDVRQSDQGGKDL